MVVLKLPTNRRPRMAQVPLVLARLKRESLADLPAGAPLDQWLAKFGVTHAWRDRLLTPLVTLRLFDFVVGRQRFPGGVSGNGRQSKSSSCSCVVAIAEDLSEQAGADAFTGVDGNRR